MCMRIATLCTVCIFLSGCSQLGDNAVTPAPDNSGDKPIYLSVDTPPAPVLSPEQALHSFFPAPGFNVQLFAAEPLVVDPVAADWDEDGRLYVAEMRAFMPDLEGAGEQQPNGTVVRLTDSNNDGVLDHRQVLVDGLVLPRAVRVVNEGLLVAEMGRLWLCPSSTGWSADIDCTDKRSLGVYGEHQGSVEHAENGLLVGLDNWLYSAKSKRRLKLLDGRLIEEPTLFRGQWGITQDDKGRFFYNTNSNLLLGDFYAAQAIVEAGNRTAPGLNARISVNDEVYSVRVNPGVNRAYVPGVLRADGRLRAATSASGMVVYRGGLFAPDDPDVFVAEPAANLVAAFKLREEGLLVSAEQRLYPDAKWGQRDFLASTDERFRPVDVLNGPDGALYVIDFYRGVIQDHVFISDELKAQARARGLAQPLGMGRIWRIVKEGGAEAAAQPDWRSMYRQNDPRALVATLDAPDIWRRSTAQRLLLRSAADDVKKQLEEVVVSGRQRAAVHALWTLEGRGELSSRVVAAALQHGEVVASAALQAGAKLLGVAQLLEILAVAAPGSSSHLYTLAGLRFHIHETTALNAVQDAFVQSSHDPYVRAMVQAAVRGREDDFIRTLVANARWTAEQEQRTQFLAQLARQLFAAEGVGAERLLDYVAELAPQQLWAQQAVLAGLFESTREPGFQRAVLAAPHALFNNTDERLWPAIAKARRGFTWPGDNLAADAKPLTPQQTSLMTQGAQFYTTSCANCHGSDGAGIGALGPPLADSLWVTQAPERLARIVLHGLQGPVQVRGKTWNSAMPGHINFAGFDDRVASGLLTYLRRSWGHAGRAIDPSFVAQVRAETSDRVALWTAAELLQININTHFTKYAGRFGRPDAPLGFGYDGQQLVVTSGIFNGPLVEQKEDHFVFEPRNLRFEFVVAEDGSVPAVVLHTGEDSVTLPRVAL